VSKCSVVVKLQWCLIWVQSSAPAGRKFGLDNLQNHLDLHRSLTKNHLWLIIISGGRDESKNRLQLIIGGSGEMSWKTLNHLISTHILWFEITWFTTLHPLLKWRRMNQSIKSINHDHCTFKWSDGRTVETIGAPPIIQHRSSLLSKNCLTVFQQELSYCNCHLCHCLSTHPTSSHCPEICVPIRREILTQSHLQNSRLLFCLSAKTNTHNVQEPIKAPVHISPHQHESTSEPQRPVLALPKHRKIQKQPKTYPPQPKNQQQKWL
jgi:hypothetical protein